ncbi:ABC transporter permease [Streptomyces sp. SD11]|uniref:ABC transporter permease n=1 Tax=Streptomyces sp. SD11 TaxID=3452209 RepID=UPI003F8B3FEE
MASALDLARIKGAARSKGVARIKGALRSPVTFSVVAGLVIGALFLVGTGADPLAAYGAVVSGSLGADGIGSTLTTGTSVLGMALALAIPLRAGLINLGGDGQMVLGGIAAAVTGLYSPLPAPLTVVLALLAGVSAGAAYAALAALCENRFGVPLLVSSLLLSYPATSLASYLVRYPLKEPGSSLPQTRRLPEGVALPAFGTSTVTAGLVLVVLAAAAYWFADRRTAIGYEIRMTGLNARFAAYAGVERKGLTLRLVATSGALAGLVGAIGVLSFPYRFLDGSLTAPGYTWTGLTAALLAAAAPLGTVVAAFFFAVLQVGGLSMERTTEVPRELTQVLQAIVIVFLAARLRFPRLRRRKPQQPQEPADPAPTAREPASQGEFA